MSSPPTLALSAASHIKPTEHRLRLWDGSDLFYRAWLPAKTAEPALFLFHRGHEHSGRFLDVVHELGLAESAVFAWDARGHGQSPGGRAYAPTFPTIVKDIDLLVRPLSRDHGLRLSNVAELGH